MWEDGAGQLGYPAPTALGDNPARQHSKFLALMRIDLCHDAGRPILKEYLFRI